MDNLRGECLLAALGLRKMLGTEPVRLDAPTREKAGKLPRLIAEAVRSFMVATSPDRASPLPEGSYRNVADALAEVQDASAMTERLTGIDPEDLAALAPSAARALDWAQAAVPRRMRQTLAGPKPAEPSGMAKARFMRLWAVANDPMVVLGDLGEHCLTRHQAAAFAEVYPALYEVTRQAVFRRIVALVAERKSWEPTHAQARQLEILLQTSSMPPELARQLQGHFAQADAVMNDPGRKPLNPEAIGGRLETPVQRLEQK